MADLSVRYLGMDLKNPLIIGSSGLTGTVEGVKKAAASGAGALVLKSIFEEQIINEMDEYLQEANHSGEHPFQMGYQSVLKDRAYDYAEALAYIQNHAQEQTLGKYLALVEESKKLVGIPIIASINCTSNYNWHYFARKIESAGADALELNIFVLPSNLMKSSAENERLYFDIIESVKQEVHIPITLKISSYFSSLAHTVIELSKTGISGMVLFNRPFHPDIDIRTLDVNAKYLFSDPSEYPNVLRWMAILSDRVACPLVASTGIHRTETVIKQILAGATAVQMVSALYRNGLTLVGDILTGMNQWLDDSGYRSINEIRGKRSQQNVSNPADFERVQFMKLYSKIE